MIRRRTETFLAIALALFSATNWAAAQPKSLAEVEEFAFGGIGAAGIPSRGETFFRGVLDQPDGLANFKTILEKGTAPAKLYALCGIRLLSEKDFESAAAPLLKSSEMVTTIHGCGISKERVAEVARQISAGSYDISLKNPPRPPPSR